MGVRPTDQLRGTNHDWWLRVFHKKLDKTMTKRSVPSFGLNAFVQLSHWQFKINVPSSNGCDLSISQR